MRRIAVVTTSRADYGIYLPVLKLLRETPDVILQLIVGGTHLMEAYGDTVRDIEADGFPISARLPVELPGDKGVEIARFMGETTQAAAGAFDSLKPDIALVLGDRHEMLAAAMAAVPLNIPLAHIHGGERTEGLIDEQVRHALTKLSHLHFVATEEYARRIRQMGEQPESVTVSGAPALDAIRQFVPDARKKVARDIGVEAEAEWILVTYHPVTLDPQSAAPATSMFKQVLEKLDAQIILTYPNADTANKDIIAGFEELAATRSNVRLVRNLGQKHYFNVLSHASVMLGNSSSGLIEAPSFDLPVVNVGDRQRGRVRGENVIDAADDEAAIMVGLERALDPVFRKRIAGQSNPYGDGQAAERIVSRLISQPLGKAILYKVFEDQSDDA